MCTTIRPEISKRNKYWISKHRHYELKHFCLQYPYWKRTEFHINNSRVSSSIIKSTSCRNSSSDPTGNFAIANVYYSNKTGLIERIARETDKDLAIYILKAVTEGLSYNQLKSKLNIPCSRDMYYDRYRRFFWLLSKERD